MKFDLSAFNLTELHILQRDITNAIEGYDSNHRRAAIMELHEVARKHGYTLTDLTGKRVRTPKGA